MWIKEDFLEGVAFKLKAKSPGVSQIDSAALKGWGWSKAVRNRMSLRWLEIRAGWSKLQEKNVARARG